MLLNATPILEGSLIQSCGNLEKNYNREFFHISVHKERKITYSARTASEFFHNFEITENRIPVGSEKY